MGSGYEHPMGSRSIQKDQLWVHVRSGGQYLIKGIAFNTISDQTDVIYQCQRTSAIFTRQMTGCKKSFDSKDGDHWRFDRVGE